MKLFDTVKYALLDGITELDAPYACDLHHHLYNLPDHFIYHAKAKEATAELDVLECLYHRSLRRSKHGSIYHGRGIIAQNIRQFGRSKMLASRRA